MLNFDEDFFKEEIRDGYLVSEMMKRCWAVQMTILDEIIKVIEKHGLTYYAEVGTLLGAVRHKGFIPWDDDIDIAMPREDYMKFLQLEEELPDDLCIRSFYNTDSFSSYHAVVAQKGELKWDKDKIDKNYGCPFLCFLDVFPLDNMPSDPQKFKLQKQLFYLSYKCAFDLKLLEEELFSDRMIMLSDLQGMGTDRSRELLENIDLMTKAQKSVRGKIFKIDENLPLRNQLYLLADEVAQMCDSKDANAIDYAPNFAFLEENKPRYNEWYSETRELKFEQFQLKAPIDYTQELINQYGEEYMVPYRGLSAHDYPFYRSEIRVMIGGDVGDNYQLGSADRIISESINTLIEAHQIIRGHTSTVDKICIEIEPDDEFKNYEAAMKLVEDLQPNAIGIGEAIENILYSSDKVVGTLEKYCDKVYELYNLLNDNAKAGDIFYKINTMDYYLNKCKREFFIATRSDSVREIPAGWEDKLYDADGNLKKVILYGFGSADIITAGSRGIQRLREFFDGFRDISGEAVIIVFVPSGLLEFVKKCKLGIVDGVEDLLDHIASLEYVIFENEQDHLMIERALFLADEYCGDVCRLYEITSYSGNMSLIMDYQSQDSLRKQYEDWKKMIAHSIGESV